MVTSGMDGWQALDCLIFLKQDVNRAIWTDPHVFRADLPCGSKNSRYIVLLHQRPRGHDGNHG